MDESVKVESKGLAENQLGLLSSIFMGIAGTAPAFSIEITTSTILAAVGVLAPASIFYSGLIMLGIAFAFINLNRAMPSAGTSYTWVKAAFGPTWGFMAGWALLASVAIFMVSGTIPIANATLLLASPEHVNDVSLIALISIMWLTIVALIVSKGIRLSGRVQNVITTIEIIILMAILYSGLRQYSHMPIVNVSWADFMPTNFTTTVFVSGAIVSLFFYWGWDVILNLSEETRESRATPGRAVIYTMMTLIAIFVAFTIVSQMVLSANEIEHYNTNIIFGLANVLWGSKWGYVAITVVLLSTLGTIETGMLQFSRTLFAKSRDGVLHSRYSELHDTWQTPWKATFVLWFIGVILIILSAFGGGTDNMSGASISVQQILADSISSIGFLISFYLAATGFACAYYYRHMLSAASVSAIYDIKKYFSLQKITHVYYPFLSAAFLSFIGLYSMIETFTMRQQMIAIISLLIGFIPYWWNRQ